MYPGIAAAETGRIEYSGLLNSTTLESVHSFSLYSPVNTRKTVRPYGVADLLWLRPDKNAEYEFNFRIALGFTSGGDLAPFFEVGTSLLDLLILLDNSDDDEDRICDDTQGNCDFDVDAKLGLRYRIDREICVNVYYQRLHLGHFENKLQGNFDIVGLGIGYTF